MIIVNINFQKDNVLDYILFKKEMLRQIKDVKVILGEECFKQHRLLVADWSLMIKKQLAKTKNQKQVKLWRLKKETM